jgi:hypothetical protein
MSKRKAPPGGRLPLAVTGGAHDLSVEDSVVDAELCVEKMIDAELPSHRLCLVARG